MCGITGLNYKDASIYIDDMTQALFHRGPDEGNVYVTGNLALGHRRLSILDLKNGHQPMVDPESGAVIVYNGEIYNHLELRHILEKKGHKFRTDHCDTETVLHSFIEWGTDSFMRFNGMFALAIYSPQKKKIWLARDRFGEKPLFYIHKKDIFAFASEIAAFKKLPFFDKNLDTYQIQRFMAWNYLTFDETLHRNCHQLLPGSWLCFDIRNESISENVYWKFSLTPDESLSEKDEPLLIEELQELILQAVRRRLISDVPLGIFLSGGIDSSSILAAVSKIDTSQEIQAFTIGFNEKSFDESTYAKQIADIFSVKHNIHFLNINEMQQTAPQILSRMTEPLGDPSLIPTYHLASFARKFVKVALTGDGGDELFAGYDPLVALKPSTFYRKVVPQVLHNLLRYIIMQLPCSDKNMSFDFKLKRFLRGLSYPQNIQLPVWMSALDPDEIANFFVDSLPPDELYKNAISLWNANSQYDVLSQTLQFFTSLYLSNDILVKTDRASMMVSLESRAVFLDNDIVRFCANLPNRFKFKNGIRKYILKKALINWLPKNILNRPKKGFGIPLNKWLRSLPSPTHNIENLRQEFSRSAEKAHKNRHGDYRFFLWNLHVLDALKTSLEISS